MEILPGLLGLGGSIAGLARGAPSSNVQPGQNPFQFLDMMSPWGDQNGLTQIRNSPNYYAQNGDQASGIAQMLANNPGANQMIQGAGAAGAMGMGAGANMYGLGQGMAQTGQGLVPYAGQILKAGFDPQNALYDRTQHQLQQQTSANLASRGLNSSPFGAGVANKASSDFNIDWQNNQLQRMNAGAQGAGLLLDQSGRDITGGASLMGQAPGMYASGAAMPYQAYNTIGQTGMGALGQLGQYGMAATQQPQQNFMDFLQMMGVANNGSNVMNNQFNSQLGQSQMGFNQNRQMGQDLGTSMASLGKSMGGMSNPFGGSNPTGYSTNPWSSGGMFGSGGGMIPPTQGGMIPPTTGWGAG